MPTRDTPLASRPKQRGASLNEAAERLKEILGDFAPSRITLHRHSAAGDLGAAVIRRSKSRAYYDIETLAEHYRPRGAQESKPPVRRSPPPPPQILPAQPPPIIDPHALAQALIKEAAPLIDRQVALALQPLSDLMTRLDRGLSDLAATRSTLMIKYDAAATLSGQRLESAQAELARLKTTESIDIQIGRVRIDLSRLAEAITRLEQSQK